MRTRILFSFSVWLSEHFCWQKHFPNFAEFQLITPFSLRLQKSIIITTDSINKHLKQVYVCPISRHESLFTCSIHSYTNRFAVSASECLFANGYIMNRDNCLFHISHESPVRLFFLYTYSVLRIVFDVNMFERARSDSVSCVGKISHTTYIHAECIQTHLTAKTKQWREQWIPKRNKRQSVSNSIEIELEIEAISRFLCNFAVRARTALFSVQFDGQ